MHRRQPSQYIGVRTDQVGCSFTCASGSSPRHGPHSYDIGGSARAEVPRSNGRTAPHAHRHSHVAAPLRFGPRGPTSHE